MNHTKNLNSIKDFDGDHTPGNVDGGGDDGAKTWTKKKAWEFFSQF